MPLIGWFDEQYLWETVFVLVFMLYMLIDQAKFGLPDENAVEGDEPAPESKAQEIMSESPPAGPPPTPAAT